MLPKKLQKRLDTRKSENALRMLKTSNNLIDFSSNDYLGFSSNPAYAKAISERVNHILKQENIPPNGASGSRLLTGNHILYDQAERLLSNFHESEAALIFNSGFDANIGFFQSVPQRGDIILFDEFIHASIRDGIQMSNAHNYKFKHNDLADLESLIERLQNIHHLADQNPRAEIYIVTESVFSMDGDSPDLIRIVALCEKYGAHCIVDEAHAVGVLGNKGKGMVQMLGVEKKIFARIVTFGKALGAHGAAILGGKDLSTYLTNYARSLIYTTALPPHTVAVIIASYEQLRESEISQSTLQKNISFFNKQIESQGIQKVFIPSESAIHSAVVSGNENARRLSQSLESQGYDIKPILSPTVPKAQERLRFCLHSFNTEDEILEVLKVFKKSV